MNIKAWKERQAKIGWVVQLRLEKRFLIDAIRMMQEQLRACIEENSRVSRELWDIEEELKYETGNH